MTQRFKVGDKVMHFGAEGVIREPKMGGYLVDFRVSKGNFVYESELVAINELEDDRGKNRML